MSKPVINREGITVKQLKDFVKDWPETNENGEDYGVWLADERGLSNVAISLWKLNQGEILLETQTQE